MLTEITFKSFNQIFAHYFEQNFEASEGIIELSDFYFRNGYFERLNNEIEKLREESFGHLFKVSDKYDHKIYLQLKKFL